jgi:TatD DNase family protein
MIDSHCHLAGQEFAADLEAVVARALDAGVTAAGCIVAAGDDAEAVQAAQVRKLWPGVRFAIGIHPHHAGEFAGALETAEATVRRGVAQHQASAIGEVGLDYHYEFSPRDIQQELFALQVRIAREMSLPVVIHTREATDDTFRILRDAGAGQLRGVFHCFTGDRQMARAALDIGFHISFSGIVTFPKAEELREAARLVPADRLLVETDAPYLAPVPHRGKRNEPAFVTRVVETLAAVRAERAAELADEVTRNFEALFAPGVAPDAVNVRPTNGLAR